MKQINLQNNARYISALLYRYVPHQPASTPHTRALHRRANPLSRAENKQKKNRRRERILIPPPPRWPTNKHLLSSDTFHWRLPPGRDDNIAQQRKRKCFDLHTSHRHALRTLDCCAQHTSFGDCCPPSCRHKRSLRIPKSLQISHPLPHPFCLSPLFLSLWWVSPVFNDNASKPDRTQRSQAAHLKKDTNIHKTSRLHTSDERTVSVRDARVERYGGVPFLSVSLVLSNPHKIARGRGHSRSDLACGQVRRSSRRGHPVDYRRDLGSIQTR